MADGENNERILFEAIEISILNNVQSNTVCKLVYTTVDSSKGRC